MCLFFLFTVYSCSNIWSLIWHKVLQRKTAPMWGPPKAAVLFSALMWSSPWAVVTTCFIEVFTRCRRTTYLTRREGKCRFQAKYRHIPALCSEAESTKVYIFKNYFRNCRCQLPLRNKLTSTNSTKPLVQHLNFPSEIIGQRLALTVIVFILNK